MGNVIDFTEGTDTGEADASSIQPLLNGQTLDQVNIPRADQNLRQRTEVLRQETNENRWVRDADRATMMYLTTGGATLTWGGHVAGGGTGELVLSAGSLVVVPATTPGEGRGAGNEGIGTTFPSRYAFAEFDDGNGVLFNIQAKALQSGGGDQVTFETVTEVGHGPLTVDVLGDPTVANPALQPGARNIVVTYDPAEAENWSDVKSAVEALPEADALVTISYSPAPDQPIFDTLQELTGAGDGIFHEITSAQIADFFLVAENELREGDTLAIWYDTPQDRRESTEELGNHLIPSASLVNLSAEPDKAYNAVILGRVVQDAFVLATGTTLLKDHPNNRPETLNIGPAKTVPVDHAPFSTLSAFNVQEVLEEVDSEITSNNTDIATNAADIVSLETEIRDDYERADNAITPAPTDGAGVGASRVGVSVSAFNTIDPLAESQQDVNDDIDVELTFLNDATQVYSSLEAFIAGTAVGDVRLVDDAHDAQDFVHQEQEVVTGVALSSVAVDGTYTYVAFSNSVQRRERSDLSTVDQTYTLSETAGVTVKRIATDGTVVAVAYENSTDSRVDLFNASTGALIWTYTNSTFAGLVDVVVMRSRVYVAENINGGDSQVVALSTTEPAPADPPVPISTYTHGTAGTNDLLGMAAANDVVYVAGTGHGAGISPNGRVQNGDHIIALSGVGLTELWGVALTNVPNQNRTLAADGSHVYFYDRDGSANHGYISVLGRDGLGVQELAVQFHPHPAGAATPRPHSIAVDHDYVYMVALFDPAGLTGADPEEWWLFVMNKRTRATVASYALGGVTGDEWQVASDGSHVFLGWEDSSGGFNDSIQRVHVRHRVTEWRRVEGNERGLAMSQLAEPLRDL